MFDKSSLLWKLTSGPFAGERCNKSLMLGFGAGGAFLDGVSCPASFLKKCQLCFVPVDLDKIRHTTAILSVMTNAFTHFCVNCLSYI